MPTSTFRHTRSGSRRRIGAVSPDLSSPNLSGIDRFVFAPRTVEKPWGSELIWAHTDDYGGKILFVRAGQSLSFVGPLLCLRRRRGPPPRM